MEHSVKEGRFTYRDYCAWDDDERWELIDGEAYAMSPSPSRAHQDYVVFLIGELNGFLRNGPCRLYAAPMDVRFEDADDADTVVQPDILVVCDPKKLRREGIVGAPDLVIEIVSPSSHWRDLVKKMALYEREGVPEYWIVMPDNRAVYRQVLTDGRYVSEVFAKGSMGSERIEGFSLDVEALFKSADGPDE